MASNNADCTFAQCGDGTLNVTAGEVCDDGNQTTGDGCDDGADGNCTVTACGNGVVTAGEQCDDACPSCDASCQLLTQPSVVFASSTLDDGNLGGVAGADAICSAQAAAAGLTGTYLAWISDSGTSPSQRFVQAPAGYVRVDGMRVACDWADLTDGTIQNPINKTESGGAPFSSVWSGTTTNGTSTGTDCNGWTTNSKTRGDETIWLLD